MFFSWVSLFSSIIKSAYEYVTNYFGNNEKFRVISINLGGRTKNPFEYLFETEHKDVFNSYKKIFKTVKKSSIVEIFETENLCLSKKYHKFFKFLTTNDIPEYVFDYFFSEESDSKKKLKLDSRYGRQDDGSDGIRFNPVEHGYDSVPFSSFDSFNQFEYTYEYSKNKLSVADLIDKCMLIADKNNMIFNEEQCNLILFDIMNILAVYNNYNEFVKIYIPKGEDTRIKQITECNMPCIVCTQEKKINDSRFNLLAVSPRAEKGGTHVYSYNFPENGVKVKCLQETNRFLGNEKGICVYLEIFGKDIKIVSLHTKNPTKIDNISCLEEFVDYGLVDLFSNIPTIIMGDLNPSNNHVSNDIKNMVIEKTGCTIYPNVNINTTKKIRSGFCAQMSKMFKEKDSEVSKDMIFFRDIEKYVDPENCSVYPEPNSLMTETWCGDHSAVWVTFDFKKD